MSSAKIKDKVSKIFNVNKSNIFVKKETYEGVIHQEIIVIDTRFNTEIKQFIYQDSKLVRVSGSVWLFHIEYMELLFENEEVTS